MNVNAINSVWNLRDYDKKPKQPKCTNNKILKRLKTNETQKAN
jgi:hypothetical protein